MGVASRDPFQVVIQVQQYFTKGTHDVQTNQLQQKSEHVIYQPFFNNYSTLHVSQRCKYHMYNITYIYMIFMNVYHTRYSFCTSNITWMFTLSRMCMPVNIPTDAEYITDCYFLFLIRMQNLCINIFHNMYITLRNFKTLRDHHFGACPFLSRTCDMRSCDISRTIYGQPSG